MEKEIIQSVIESIATKSAVFALRDALLDVDQKKVFDESYKKHLLAFGSYFAKQYGIENLEEHLKNNQ